jgi:tRNA(Ile)-lysidine synthase
MLAEVRRFMRREAMPLPETPTWVAVSGGVDSMVLLHVLRGLGHDCIVAHVDHGLRGAASDGDRRFVEDHATRLGLPFRSVRVDVKSAADGISVQMAARKLRYDWFSELLFEGPDRMAMGHHRDDATETLLLNLLRGVGGHGWAGIQPVTAIPGGPVYRPLLCVGREQIMAYALENNIPFRDDASNADPKYLRNRVRNEMLPFLEKLRPGAGKALARAAGMLREMTIAADKWTERATAQLVPDEEGTLRIPIKLLRTDGALHLLLHHLLRDHRPHPDVIDQLVDAVLDGATGAMFYIADLRITVNRDQLIMGRAVDGFPSFTINLAEESGAAGQFRWERCVGAPLPTVFGPHTAWLDLAKLKEPLVLRPWKEADRMRPAGLGGSKLVSDLLIDAKVPRNEKNGAYVLESDGTILWLVGHRIAEGVSAKVTSSTVLRVDHDPRTGSPA